MERWQQMLRDGDPVSREPALAREDVERMRRAVLSAEPAAAPHGWSLRLAVVSAAVVALAGGFWGLRPHGGDSPALAGPASSPGGPASALDTNAPPHRRQVQFATPGGTRVIWVFDSTFDLR